MSIRIEFTCDRCGATAYVEQVEWDTILREGTLGWAADPNTADPDDENDPDMTDPASIICPACLADGAS